MLICVVAATVYSLTESPANTQEHLRQNNYTKTCTGKNNSEEFLVPGWYVLDFVKCCVTGPSAFT